METRVFEHEYFGKVRMVLIDGQPYFVGNDVAKVLGYRSPRHAINKYVNEGDKMVNYSFTVNGTPPILINETGVYSLMLSSHLPIADKFERWIASEVLPSIRRHAIGEALPDMDESARIFGLEREKDDVSSEDDAAEANAIQAQPSSLERKKIQVGCYFEPETHRRLSVLARLKGISIGEMLCNAGVELIKKYSAACDEAEAILRKWDAQELKIQ